MVDGGYAYLYSTHDQAQRLARVPLAAVTNPNAYEFWNGSTWVTEPNYNSAVALDLEQHAAARHGPERQPQIRYTFGGTNGPIAGLWVVRHGNGYLGTAKLVNAYSGDVSLFTAPAPQGPWTYVGTAANTPSGRFSYGAQTTFRLQGMSPTPVTIYSTNVPGTPNTIFAVRASVRSPGQRPATVALTVEDRASGISTTCSVDAASWPTMSRCDPSAPWPLAGS